MFMWIGRVSPRFKSTDICQKHDLSTLFSKEPKETFISQFISFICHKSCKTIAYDSITHPYFNLYYWDYWYGIISQTKPKTWGLIWDNRHLTQEYFLVMCYLTNEFISIFFFGTNKLLTSKSLHSNSLKDSLMFRSLVKPITSTHSRSLTPPIPQNQACRFSTFRCDVKALD